MAIGTAAALLGSAAIGAVSGAVSSNQNKKAIESANAANAPDPRIAQTIFGDGGANTGLLSQYQGLGQQPQSAGLLAYGQGQDSYLGANGAQDMGAMRTAANGLMGSNIAAPTMQAAQAQAFQNGPAAQAQGAQSNSGPGVNAFGTSVLWNKGETYNAPDAMKAAQIGAPGQVSGAQVNQPQGMQATMADAASVNAPAQNKMDLTGSYDKFINGDAGANPYLTKALDGAMGQSNQAFQRMQDDSTRNLNENVLGNIRSNSILSGQYGGSRQGIAEGRALGDFAREQQRAIENFGNNNTTAAVGAQAQSFNQGQDRALSATQGLGAQQYGVAQQNASMQQQSSLANAAASNAAAQTNFGGLLSGAMANAGYDQQAALANQGANLAASTTNAGLQQDASKTNYAGQLGVNAGNAANLQQANLANQNAGNAASTFNAQQGQNASSQNATLGQQNNQFNAGLTQSNNQFNTGLQQQNNQFNTGALNNNGQFNAGLLQQAAGNNLDAQQRTSSLNSANQLGGIGASGGLLSQALGTATNQDNYALNRATQTNGLLAPYLTRNGAQSQPVYQNTAGNVLGGAMAGLGLYNQFKGASSAGGTNNPGAGTNGYVNWDNGNPGAVNGIVNWG